MSEQELRIKMECLSQAIRIHTKNKVVNVSAILETAKKLEDYLSATVKAG